jgi:hypothetical protein
VLSRLRRIMTVDAAFFGTVDPQTLLFTSAADDPLRAATPLFLDNEYGRADVNKFAALAEAADPVSSLDRATRGQRAGSARYREVMSPLGLGDREVDLIRRVAPHVAEGLRRAVTLGPVPAPVTSGAAGPGMIVLDHNLTVMSLNAEAAQWLAEIDEADWPSGSELPMAVYAAAARLTRLVEGAASAPLSASVRLRSRSGRGSRCTLPGWAARPRRRSAWSSHPPRPHSSARCCSARTGSPARSPGSSPWSSRAARPARSPRNCTSPRTPCRST